MNLRFQCGNVRCGWHQKPVVLQIRDELIQTAIAKGGKRLQYTCQQCGYLNYLSLPSSDAAAPLQKVFDSPSPESKLPEELGWLVWKEGTNEEVRYPLQLGVNLVGKRNSSRPASVLIDTTDPNLSRNHFAIDIRLNGQGRLEYLISDCNAAGDGNLSLNGTYLNDRPEPLHCVDRIFLSDGDAIRAGQTYLTIRTVQQTFAVPGAGGNHASPQGKTIIL